MDSNFMIAHTQKEKDSPKAILFNSFFHFISLQRLPDHPLVIQDRQEAENRIQHGI